MRSTGAAFVVGSMSLMVALGCNAITGADALGVDERATTGGGSSSSTNGSASGTSSSGSAGGGSSSGDGSSSGESSSGSSGEPSSASSSGGSSSGTSSGGSSSGTSSGASSSSGTPSGTAVIDEPFATEASCLQGTTTNGATKSWAADMGVTNGACMICATNAGDSYFELTGVVGTDGRATPEAHARRLAGRTTPGSASMVAVVGGANVSTTYGIDENAWTRLGGASFGVRTGASVNIRVGIASAAVGDCVLIDDIRVTIK